MPDSQTGRWDRVSKVRVSWANAPDHIQDVLPTTKWCLGYTYASIRNAAVQMSYLMHTRDLTQPAATSLTIDLSWDGNLTCSAWRDKQIGVAGLGL